MKKELIIVICVALVIVYSFVLNHIESIPDHHDFKSIDESQIIYWR